jgi:hypothetical protein
VKTAILSVVVIFVLASVASSVSTSDRMPEKIPQHSDPGVPDGREGGEAIQTAWDIISLPFHDTGNTCDNINDYDEACPYTDSTAPDVVYSYTPMEDECISISLCNSLYDTKVYVYEDTYTPGMPVACNDDAFNCEDPPVSYTSWIEEVDVEAGHTYYIVIDGYDEECGDYVLDITPLVCYELDCEGTPEGEPTCYENYVDHYNGGCNSSPPAFQDSWGDVTWCGESGVYETDTGLYRDTDWYLLRTEVPSYVTLTVEAEFYVVFGLVEAVDCQHPYFYDYATAYPGVQTELTYHFNTASYIVAFVAPGEWNPEYECGSEYMLKIEGDFFWCPVEGRSWGAVKALYR